MSPSDLPTKFAELQRAFGSTLPDKIERLQSLLHPYANRIALSQGESHDALQAAHLLTHGLAGSAGIFGFKTLGEVAHELEILLLPLLHGEVPDTLQFAGSIKKALSCIRVASEEPPRSTAAEFAATMPISTQAIANERTIYLVESDPNLAAILTLQLAHFGYRVYAFDRPGAVVPDAKRPMPLAIVMEVGSADSGLAGPQGSRDALHNCYHGRPLLFLSASGEFAERLEAVRAGGVAYFTKPLDLDGLADALEASCGQTTETAYRILIVDDAESTGAFYRQVLTEAGMQAMAIHDPSQISSPLADFAPDLILMDLYMPGCSGIELATLIRQQPNFVAIPIVFLSSETNTNRQLVALRQGGDDFLCKPIDPARLVSVVTSRVARARILRAQMATDGLTGLLNHRHLKDRLQTEIERSQRQGKPLVFAMLDVDYFKRVNDTWGHAAGDRVLRSLAKLLQQRLRRTDVAGRYGGEEFGVIFCDTEETAAMAVLDTIRRDFGALRHASADVEFSVTFSAGIAQYPTRPIVDTLIAAADAALYVAKQAGRDRIAIDANQ